MCCSIVQRGYSSKDTVTQLGIAERCSSPLGVLAATLHYSTVLAELPSDNSQQHFDDYSIFSHILECNSILPLIAMLVKDAVELMHVQIVCQATSRACRVLNAMASTVHTCLASHFWPHLLSVNICGMLVNLIQKGYTDLETEPTNSVHIVNLLEVSLLALGSLCGGPPYSTWHVSMYEHRMADNIGVIHMESKLSPIELKLITDSESKIYQYGSAFSSVRECDVTSRIHRELNQLQLQQTMAWEVYCRNFSYTHSEVISQVIYPATSSKFGISVSISGLRLVWALIHHNMFSPRACEAQLTQYDPFGFMFHMTNLDPMSKLLAVETMGKLVMYVDVDSHTWSRAVEILCGELCSSDPYLMCSAISFLSATSSNRLGMKHLSQWLLPNISCLLSDYVGIRDEKVDSLL